MELNSLVATGMTEPRNSKGQGVAFSHPRQGGRNIIMIDKVNVASRQTSDLQTAMNIKEFITLAQILEIWCLGHTRT